jgi:CBS domain-containing protein
MAVTSPPTFLDESLQDALDKMAQINVNGCPVVLKGDTDEISGMIAKRDIINLFH